MESAIAKEEEELDDGMKTEYETQRKMVKDRLSFLIISTGELLKTADGTVGVTPSVEGLEVGYDQEHVYNYWRGMPEKKRFFISDLTIHFKIEAAVKGFLAGYQQ